jgi:hypothetical protein
LKPRPNEPCPCGYGREWQHCCGALPSWELEPTKLPVDEFAVSWYCASEVTLEKIPWAVIAGEVAGWARKTTFLKFARMAAAMQNIEQPRSSLVGWSRKDLEDLRDSSIAEGSKVARTFLYRWDCCQRGRITVSEKGLLLAEALVLAHGADDGREPSHAEATWLLLRLNDYASEYREDVDGGLLAEIVHSVRFNRHPDLLRELARAELVLASPPSTRPDLQGDAWQDFLRAAFADLPLATYVDNLLAPLAIESTRWMANEQRVAPTVEADVWGTNLRLGKEVCAKLLRALAIPEGSARAESKESLKAESKRLPPFMFRTPMVDFGQSLVVASPSLLRGQLQTGIWGRCLAAARSTTWGSRESDAWHKVFGTLFDQYAEWVAAQASKMPAFSGAGYELLGRSGVGAEDEIEDVVLKQGDHVLLASCKARLMPETAVRQIADPGAIMKWLDQVFFKEGKDEHRQGAAFLLSRRVDRLRNGEFEPRAAKGARVFPLFVTYDHLGESKLHLKWLADGAEKRRLLGQGPINPPIVIDIAAFEELMSFAGRGGDIWSVLESVGLHATTGGSVDGHLREITKKSPEVLRLPALEAKFEEIMARTKANFIKVN